MQLPARLIWILLGFQAVWFSVAWGISHEHPLLPIVIGLLYLNTYIRFEPNKSQAYQFLLKVAILGFVLDTNLGFFHVIEFLPAHRYPAPFAWIQPWWLSLLWFGFAASSKASFAWLIHRPVLTPFLGFIFGPIAYLGAAKFGVFSEISSWGLLIIGFFWAITLTLLVKWISKDLSSNKITSQLHE